MGEEIPFVSDDEIRTAAETLQKVAIQVKGEKELRYVSQDPKDAYYGYGGRDSERYSGLPFAVGPDKKYMGTAEDWAKLTAQYSWITDAFVHHIGADPRQIEPLSSPLESVAGKLYFTATAQRGQTPPGPVEPIRDRLGTKVETLLADWTGDAAVRCRANFVAPIPGAAQAQAYLAVALAAAIIGNRDMFLANRKDLLTIAEQGAIAVGRAGECQLPKFSDETKAKLALVGAVATIAAGVASIPVTGGSDLRKPLGARVERTRCIYRSLAMAAKKSSGTPSCRQTFLRHSLP